MIQHRYGMKTPDNNGDDDDTNEVVDDSTENLQDLQNHTSKVC